MSNNKSYLEKLSPSKVEYIDNCKFRFYKSTLEEIVRNTSKPFNRFTFLGTVIHNVIECYFKEKKDLNEFEDIWKIEIYKEINLLNSSINLDYVKYHTQYYVVKKNQTLNLLKNLSGYFSLAKSEVRVTSELVEGIVDLIIIDDKKNSVRIIDYKTGPIWEYLEGIRVQIKDSYIIQLKTYGYTFWKKGYSPENIECELIGLSQNDSFITAFTEIQYQDHERMMKHLISDFNTAVDSSTIETFARPLYSTCKYCDFVSECPKLHSELLNSGVGFDGFSIITEINSEFVDQFSKVNISTNGGIESIHKIPNQVLLDLKKIVNTKGRVLITSLYKIQNSRVKIWTKNTEYLKLTNL